MGICRQSFDEIVPCWLESNVRPLAHRHEDHKIWRRRRRRSIGKSFLGSRAIDCRNWKLRTNERNAKYERGAENASATPIDTQNELASATTKRDKMMKHYMSTAYRDTWWATHQISKRQRIQVISNVIWIFYHAFACTHLADRDRKTWAHNRLEYEREHSYEHVFTLFVLEWCARDFSHILCTLTRSQLCWLFPLKLEFRFFD